MSISYKNILLSIVLAMGAVFAFALGFVVNEFGFTEKPWNRNEVNAKDAPGLIPSVETTNREDKLSTERRVAVANLDSKKGRSQGEIDESKFIEDLIANLTEANMDGLLAIYQTLANDPAAFQKRSDMLKSVARIKDMNLASSFIKQAVGFEGKGTYGTSVACFGGALLLQLWEKDSSLLQSAREEFITTNNPRLKLCLYTGLLVMKPEGFMADIASAFFSTDDVELRHSIISNLGELISKDAQPGDFGKVLPLCRDALYGPLKNEDHHRVADAALKTAGDAARCDPGTKIEIVNLLLGFAARPEVTEENFIEAVEQLYRVDKSSLDTLAVTAQIESPVARERLFSLISKK